jgi:formylglycine-generating enzyme required for sulfatase activity
MRIIYANWAVLLLPHLGHDGLYAAFDPDLPISDPTNARARATELALMKCPSDAHHRPDNSYRIIPKGGEEGSFARGSYAINGGVSHQVFAPGRPWDPAPNGLVRDYVQRGEKRIERIYGNGVAGFNKSFSVQQFDNGLSNLVGIEEVRAGLCPDDCRGVWALGEVGASATWAHGMIGDDVGPNCRHPRADDVIGCDQSHQAFGEADLICEGMPCCSYALSSQATSRSMHPGGVHVLMMDGAVRFVEDHVDPSIWHAMHSRQTREVPLPTDCEPPDPASIVPPPESVKAAATPAEEESAAVVSITNSIGMELVRIRAGEFIMGLADKGKEQEDPVHGTPPEVPPHSVRITRDFYLGAFEVTQQQYQQVMGSNPSWHAPEGGGRIEVIGEDPARFPVEQVSWTDALTFCCRLSAIAEEKQAGRSYRLPTEAEWEYASRSGSRERFSPPARSLSSDDAWGFNVRPNSPEGLPVRPVGSYQPNAFGLYDMRGNVWEWCQDWFAWDYYRHSPRDDPPGPASGVLRVVRGSDWRLTLMGCNYTRVHTEPWRTNRFIGFRVACDVASQSNRSSPED